MRADQGVEKRGTSRLDDLAIDRLTGKDAVPLPVLVGDLSRDLGYTKDKVAAGLMGLQSRKLIVISEGKPYASFSSYAASPLSVWFWGAVGATLLSLALFSVTSGVGLYLRYAFGSVLILFLPGYSIMEALYPKRELEELTKFALSVGLSLALVPLVGLALNYTPFGIRLLPVGLSIAGVTLALLVLALRRKHVYYKVAQDLA
jgi:Protein of unknown function (DUF1616)